MYIKSEQRP